MLLLSLLASSKYSPYEAMFDKLKRHRVTVAQVHLMCILASQGNNWTKMSALVSHMSKKSRMSQSAVSRAIANLGEVKDSWKEQKKDKGIRHYESDRMQAHGFVETKSDEDGRYLLFRLNKDGFRFLDKTFNI